VLVVQVPVSKGVQVSLIGRHVRLRPITPDDAEITQKWRMSGRAFLLNKGAQTVEEQRAWIASRPASEQDFIMVLEATNQRVGMIALVDIDKTHRRAEAGHFLIGEPDLVKGKPVAAEATRLLYHLAFDWLHLHSVYGMLSVENEKMITWNKYLGMREEGRLKVHYWLNDRWHDALFLNLLEGDYRTITVPTLRGLIGY
jgi:RimJ/RimL family protein N-acetyltransferase